ncbi:hypothetical protein AB4Z54_68675, partial [Streptomyces sp. MCAF7]
TPAVERGGELRDGAWGAELDGDCLTGRPRGRRLIVRKERLHPDAQLRFTDVDQMRLTCFATSTAGEAIAPSNRATGSGPAPRTASAPPASPACATAPSTTLLRHQHGGRGDRPLEPRHRQRARAEDGIRAARVTGLRNRPLHD